MKNLIKIILLLFTIIMINTFNINILFAKTKATITSDSIFNNVLDKVHGYLDDNIKDIAVGRILKIERNIGNTIIDDVSLEQSRVVVRWDIDNYPNTYSAIRYSHPNNIKVNLIPEGLELTLITEEKALNKSKSTTIDNRIGGEFTVSLAETESETKINLLSPKLQGENRYRYDENLRGSPFTLNSGNTSLTNVIDTNRLIEVQLINSINSEYTNGLVIAVFPKHVYGGHGNKILIPSGSRIEGRYNSLQAGNSRIQIKFHKITTPNGDNIIENGLADAYDPNGNYGLQGTIHYDLEKRLAALGINIGFQAISAFLQDRTSYYNLDINTTTTTITSPAEEIDNTTQKIVEDMLNLITSSVPIIEVPAGANFLIAFNNYVVFRENQDSIDINSYDNRLWGIDSGMKGIGIYEDFKIVK